MNMSLSDIKTIMESGDKNKLTEYLIQEKSRKLQQMAELKRPLKHWTGIWIILPSLIINRVTGLFILQNYRNAGVCLFPVIRQIVRFQKWNCGWLK